MAIVRQGDNATAPNEGKGSWIGFKVVSVREILARARSAGTAVLLEPTKFMGTVVALIQDPDGHTLEIVEAQSVPHPIQD
jgi:predicted enzyme related to lactoylglutathione lyase